MTKQILLILLIMVSLLNGMILQEKAKNNFKNISDNTYMTLGIFALLIFVLGCSIIFYMAKHRVQTFVQIVGWIVLVMWAISPVLILLYKRDESNEPDTRISIITQAGISVAVSIALFLGLIS